MVVPIILGAVAETPGIGYQSLREILKPYVKDYAATDSILQDSRRLAKELLFGSAEENVFPTLHCGCSTNSVRAIQ